MLGLNVLIEYSGPHPLFNSFPYEFDGIIPELDGSKKKVVINNKEDIMDYALKLKQESEDLNGSGPDTLVAVFEQLPFFCCFSNIFDSDCQGDIEKYLYCNETSTPAYSGTYNDTPKIWIRKYYIIKTALALREKLSRDKVNEAKNGSK